MIESGIQPNMRSYEIIVKRLTEEKNLEMALSMLTQMEDQHLSPSAETAESVIILASNVGNARLALDLATSYESASVRPLSAEAWVRCLGACAEKLYVRFTQPPHLNLN